jgi:hypothetical protein
MLCAPNSSTGATRSTSALFARGDSRAAILLRLPVRFELVVAIGLAVGRDRLARRLHRCFRIVATALVALEMLGDPVVSRFIATR